MYELKFTHQFCKFHLIKDLEELINKEAKKSAKLYRNRLKKNPKILSKTKIDKKCDEFKKLFRKESEGYVVIFKELFNQENLDEAINYVNLLKKHLNIFPKYLKDFIVENFMMDYRKYLRYLEKDHVNKLESTNNKIENYFGNTLNKHIKKIYRTREGLFSFLMIRKNGWIENNKSALTS